MNFKKLFIVLKDINITIYNNLKIEFIYHSNKLEGSTFSMEEISKLIDNEKMTGTHDVDDVYSTLNSIKLFDFVIDTVDEKFSVKVIREYHAMLMKNTKIDEVYHRAGQFKHLPNTLKGVNVKLAQPYEVEEKLNELVNQYNKLDVVKIEDIADFHYKFEQVHPFLDGNGRVGRFIIFRQCLFNGIIPPLIDSKNNNEYKTALYEAQANNNSQPLYEVLKEAQNVFLKQYGDILKQYDNYQAEIEQMYQQKLKK